MFAPTGYALFEEIRDRIHKIVAEAYPLFGKLSAIEVARQRRWGRHFALAEFSSKCRSLSVASPEGTVLRVSPIILSLRAFDFPLGPYTFLDVATGLVSTDQTEQVANWAIGELTPFLAEIDEDPSRQMELEGEMTDLQDAVQARDYIKAFKKFDGWSVVCKIEDLPEHPSEFDCLDDREDVACSPRAPTREIVSKIVALVDQGDNPVRDQLWKSEFKDLKREEFRAIWAEAARKRPKLSKRGPKAMK